jgi:phosphatidate cytidylyltransferase
MRPVATRISVGAAMIVGVGAILAADVPLSAWAGRPLQPGFWAILTGCLLVGGWEFFRMLRRSGRPCRPVHGLIFIGLFVAAAWSESNLGGLSEWLHARQLELYLLLVMGLVFVTFLAEVGQVERGKDLPTALVSVAYTVLVVLTVGLLGVFLAKVRCLSADPVEGLLYLVLTLAVVKVSDIGAYAVGTAVGRRPLVPRISPRKTVEGLVGGLAAGIGTAVAIGLAWGRFGLGAMLLFGAAVSVSSVLGDLAESMMKRACGVKDSGSIPGFGGLLDILDSMLAAGPVAYLMLVLLTGPPQTP